MPQDQLQAFDGVMTQMQPGEQKPVVVEKKRKHKLTEQKGRQKINTQITDLKNLLPECKYVITTKASILECAVKSLQRLQGLCNQLMQSNKHMQKENRRLKMELIKLSGGQMNFPLDEGLNSCDESIEDQGKAGYNPNSMGIADLCNIDNLLGSDDLENFGQEYQSSPNSSPPFISSSSSGAYGSPPGSSGNEDQSPEDESAKVSRRRLLLVFLFMIPFFLTIESYDALLPHPGDNSQVRGLKENDIIQETAFEYYFDIARFFWYMILGTLGMTWVANALLWMNGLGKHSNFIVKKASKVMRAIVEPERS